MSKITPRHPCPQPRMHRAADWTPELCSAMDEWESADDAAREAKDGDEFLAAVQRCKEAWSKVGAEFLRLDRIRRGEASHDEG